MIVDLSAQDVRPDREAVLASVGVLPGLPVPDHIATLYERAAAECDVLMQPVGIFEPLGADLFAAVYPGEGQNAPETPLGTIYPQADHLALFAVTLGEAVSAAIAAGFAEQDFAHAAMLDAAASDAADRAAEVVERRVEAAWRADGWTRLDGGVLRYSPGYCGWHVSGQRRLFGALRPERIGITLNDSCLMRPLKSVSGVIVAGATAIHRFAPTYTFCSSCETFNCRDRLRSLAAR